MYDYNSDIIHVLEAWFILFDFKIKYDIIKLMKEIVDLYNENGKVIGQVEKSEAHKKGLLHKTIHVWILNNNNELLLQKRCEKKDYFPLYWDVSIGGHIESGESSTDCAIREAKEELGLSLSKDDFKYLFTVKEELVYNDINCKEFADVFLVKKDINIKDLKYQKEEVENAKFIKLEEFFKICKSKSVFPHLEEYEKLKNYL